MAQSHPADICDFSRSYMTFFLPVNVARIQIVARCLVTDEHTGVTEETVLIWPCKSELMYRDDNLYQVPNYDFCGIWSRGEFLILRTHSTHDSRRGAEWDAGTNVERFDDVMIDIAAYRDAQLLMADEEVVRATLAHHPLVARTHVCAPDRELRAVVEYPITTMNVVSVDADDRNAGRFQVDTGPVIIPAWDQGGGVSFRGERPIEQFDLAFICYNRREGHTEFVIREPTPTPAGEIVWHYSRVVKTTARHEIFRCA